MTDITQPAAANFAWRDAEETLDYEHAECPRLNAEVAMVFHHARDGRSITVWTDRPDCVRWEMELAGADEGGQPIGADS